MTAAADGLVQRPGQPWPAPYNAIAEISRP
ncbi:hypothetical protein BDD41_4284 [Paracoccus versutus]|uniref:Uncharacterized protein n=1 Tax=Paracoccus versutus TaxID=34007 RepID=A0A3D9XGM5_PARVE|nr:hypothetical protein BDD41_4284 [Paracoccus versutus]